MPEPSLIRTGKATVSPGLAVTLPSETVIVRLPAFALSWAGLMGRPLASRAIRMASALSIRLSPLMSPACRWQASGVTNLTAMSRARTASSPRTNPSPFRSPSVHSELTLRAASKPSKPACSASLYRLLNEAAASDNAPLSPGSASAGILNRMSTMWPSPRRTFAS